MCPRILFLIRWFYLFSVVLFLANYSSQLSHHKLLLYLSQLVLNLFSLSLVYVALAVVCSRECSALSIRQPVSTTTSEIVCCVSRQVISSAPANSDGVEWMHYAVQRRLSGLYRSSYSISSTLIRPMDVSSSLQCRSLRSFYVRIIANHCGNIRHIFKVKVY